MKTLTTIIYEQSDFDEVQRRMTKERAIEILKGLCLPRGWFPYNKPEWGISCTAHDLDNYEICLAIQMAIDSLSREVKHGCNFAKQMGFSGCDKCPINCDIRQAPQER